MDEDFMTDIERIKVYLKEKVPVCLYYNDETGIAWWSVKVCDIDFWLDSFKTKKEAKEYCQKHELPIIKEMVHYTLTAPEE